MAANVIHDLAPGIASGVIVEVSGHVLGRSLIDGLRRNIFPSGQVEQGDHYMDRSRELLQKHLKLIQLHEKDTILDYYEDVRTLRERLENPNGSIVQRFVQARNYRHKSRRTYKIVKRASDRAVDGHLMDQIADATRINGPGVGSGNGAGIDPVASTTSNPFTDSHAISTLTDVAVNDIDRVDMSTFQNADTGESAVVFDVHGRDSTTQHIVATYPTEVFSGDRTDGEATAALSLHREDGSAPRLIATPLPDVSSRETRRERRGSISARDEGRLAYSIPKSYVYASAETNSVSSFGEGELYGAASENGE